SPTPRPWLAPHVFDPPSHLADRLPLCSPAREILALVVRLLTARDGQRDLHPAADEVQRQRDEGRVAVADLTDQGVDLAAVQQELAGPLGRVIGPTAV